MGSRTEERSAGVRFPFAVQDNDKCLGVQRIAVNGSAQSFVFPKNMKKGFLYFSPRANGGSLAYVQVAASAGAVTLALNQISNAAAGTSSAAAGITVEVGEVLDRMLVNAGDRLNWIGNHASGYVEFYVSEE